MTYYLFGFFALFMLIRVPIAISISAASMVSIVLGSQIPVLVIIQRMYNAVNSFPLMAIPFFILAGGIMETAGLSRRLIDFGLTLVGPLRGGLAQVSVLTSMFFSAISGSDRKSVV